MGTGVGHACFENNCQNKARCHGDEKAYKCRCADGWEGKTCLEGKNYSFFQGRAI